jgi:hypothetical protein
MATQEYLRACNAGAAQILPDRAIKVSMELTADLDWVSSDTA